LVATDVRARQQNSIFSDPGTPGLCKPLQTKCLCKMANPGLKKCSFALFHTIKHIISLKYQRQLGTVTRYIVLLYTEEIQHKVIALNSRQAHRITPELVSSLQQPIGYLYECSVYPSIQWVLTYVTGPNRGPPDHQIDQNHVFGRFLPLCPLGDMGTGSSLGLLVTDIT